MKKDITSRVTSAADIPDSLKIIEKMIIYQNTKNRGNKREGKTVKRKNNDVYKKTEWMLYNYKMLKVSVQNLQSEIQELKMDTIGTGAIRYDKEKTSPTYN